MEEALVCSYKELIRTSGHTSSTSKCSSWPTSLLISPIQFHNLDNDIPEWYRSVYSSSVEFYSLLSWQSSYNVGNSIRLIVIDRRGKGRITDWRMESHKIMQPPICGPNFAYASVPASWPSHRRSRQVPVKECSSRILKNRLRFGNGATVHDDLCDHFGSFINLWAARI